MLPNRIWIPRILALAEAIFLSLFALDVWQEHNTMLARAEALLIHLLPSIIILLALLISWKRPRLGALFFTALGAIYIINEWGHWSAIGLIATPLIIIGMLFWFASAKN